MSESNGTIAKVACRECGRSFDPEKQSLKTIRDYNLTAQGAICRNRPECRGRQLHAEMNKRGLKRWAPHTQEQLLARMDCPPKDWDRSKPWESINSIEVRVEAAIEFYSTCWPVCLLYAVQTDEEGEPIKEYGDWKRHTHRSLATLLLVNQSTVTRAILDLKLRKRLVDEDGCISCDLSPKSLLPSERDACARPEYLDQIGVKGPYGILLPSARKLLFSVLHILEAEDPDACAELRQSALDVCAQQKREASESRARAVQAIHDACQAHVSLLSRLGEVETEKHACSDPPPENGHASEQTPLPSQGGGEDKLLPTVLTPQTDAHRDHEQLYAAIPRWQDDHPGTKFAGQRFTLGKAERGLVANVIAQLTYAPCEKFVPWIDGILVDRPHLLNYSTGILIKLAEEFNRDWKAGAPLRAAEVQQVEAESRRNEERAAKTLRDIRGRWDRMEADERALALEVYPEELEDLAKGAGG